MFQRKVQDPGVSPWDLKSEILPVPGGMPRRVGKKLLIKFVLGFDLAFPSDFLGITQPGTGIHGSVQTQLILENSVPQLHLKVTGREKLGVLETNCTWQVYPNSLEFAQFVQEQVVSCRGLIPNPLPLAVLKELK